MKRMMAMLLMLCVALTCFGCVAEDRPYVPSGDALVAEDNSVVVTTPQEFQELTLTYYADRSMNPYQSNDFTNRALFSLLYQSLFVVDRNYEVVPVLCSRYQVSADMKTYTIYIDEKATFSDGSALTVQDVLASYRAAQASEYYKGRFVHVSEIVVEGDAVVFRLSTPMEHLTMLLDVPIVKASQTGEALPLGTGPYTFNGAITSAYLSRVTSWWCADRADLAVTAASIHLVPAESPSQIRDQFQFYDLDVVCANPCSDLYADYRCDFELWDCENGEMIYLACNVAHREIFTSDALRSVLTYAIDRESLASEFYGGFALSATLPASPDSPCYNSKLAAQYGYAPDKFVTAVQEANPKTMAITLLVNSADSRRIRVANRVASMLEEAGFTVTVSALRDTAYTTALKKGSYDLHLGQTKLSPNMDLSAFFNPKGSLNYGGMTDAGIYALCQEAMANTGNYYTLHQKVMTDGMLCPILFRSYAVYCQRGVVPGLEPARDNIFWYDLGKTMESARLEVDE